VVASGAVDREEGRCIDRNDTAVVFTDPQNEVLSETGLAWPLVHESLAENDTVENIGRIFEAAKRGGFEVFISPHYFYPVDAGWKFNGPLEADEAAAGFFRRAGMLANMCVESHMRELIEQGFEVAVVKDATAAPKHPTWGYGYTAALINYAYLAHAALRTEEVVAAMAQHHK
jgi:nicotinamidase-related amidase